MFSKKCDESGFVPSKSESKYGGGMGEVINFTLPLPQQNPGGSSVNFLAEQWAHSIFIWPIFVWSIKIFSSYDSAGGKSTPGLGSSCSTAAPAWSTAIRFAFAVLRPSALLRFGIVGRGDSIANSASLETWNIFLKYALLICLHNDGLLQNHVQSWGMTPSKGWRQLSKRIKSNDRTHVTHSSKAWHQSKRCKQLSTSWKWIINALLEYKAPGPQTKHRKLRCLCNTRSGLIC